MNPRAFILAARILLVAMAALVAHLATTDQSYPVASDVPDTVNHVLAFGALALLADFSFPATRFGAAKVLPLLAYGALIEVVQSFLPYREASLADLAADATGIAIYAVAMPLVLRAPFLRALSGMRGPP